MGVFCFFRQILWYLSFWFACKECVCVIVCECTCVGVSAQSIRMQNIRIHVCVHTHLQMYSARKKYEYMCVCIRTCTYVHVCATCVCAYARAHMCDMHHMYWRMPEHTVLCPSQGKAHTCAFVWESTYMHTGDSPPSQKKKQQLDHNIYGLPEHTLLRETRVGWEKGEAWGVS